MKRILQLLLLLVLPYGLLAQITTLQWSDNQRIYAGADTIDVLSFEGAQYTDASFLPYYSYKENITSEEAENYEYSFSLSQLVFSEINPDIPLNTAFILDDFQVDGKVTSARRVYALEAFIVPFKKINGQLYRLESFVLEIEKKPIIKLKSATSWFADNSVLASGNWYKVAVKKDGIYKLSYPQLRAMGVDPSQVSIFTGTAGMEPTLIHNYVDDLKEIPIYDGGDYILFYGQACDTWTYNTNAEMYEHEQHLFWNENYYFISSDVGEAKRIKARTEPNAIATQNYTSYVNYAFVEPEESNIGHSGRDWFSSPVSSGKSLSHTFTFSDVLQSTAKARIRVAAVSYDYNNYLTIHIDGDEKEQIDLSKVSTAGTTDLASYQTASYSFTPVGNQVEIAMDYTTQENEGKAYVDYFAVEVMSELKLNESYLLFRNKPLGEAYVSYTIANAKDTTMVWDVSNCYDVRTVAARLDGDDRTFVAEGSADLEFAAINMAATIPSPELKGKVENQNLHASSVPDMVIVTHHDFAGIADDLANIHRKRDGMEVLIVTQDLIFNEFSGGKADVTAIRWFMKMLYDRSADSDKFKYLLMMGDGSYNNRMYEAGTGVEVEPSLVMTYQSIESIYGSSTYLSDDYYGLLDDDEGNSKVSNVTTGESYIEKYDKVDIGIGRIPITTVSEGEDVVHKIDTYLKNAKRSTWKNRVCLVADDEDNNVHVSDADKLAEKIRKENPSMAVKKVFIDAFEQVKESTGNSYPDAKKLSDQYLDEGILIWSYTGHGSPTALSGEKMMDISDINGMKNLANLPIWLTATCDFCPYDHNDELSAGEMVLLNPIGGGIALFTTTRLVYSSSNYVISNNFYSYIMKSDADGQKLRLGDIARLTKQATGTGANKRKFALIGDPAVHLLNPEANWNVVTDSINGEEVALFSDTLQSLSTMRVSGHIAKADGSVDTDFNGLLYPIVYDKLSQLSTLGNDASSEPMDFVLWKSVLYKGKTDVINGRYSFTFMLPKDMDYTPGKGRIEYYATSPMAEANGYYENFYVGGFNAAYVQDTLGPEIKLYMNSPAFAEGGVVDPNPVLLAEISDASGINTSTSALGHHITMMLNKDSKTLQNITTAYSPDAEDFTKGNIFYSLSDLAEGEYTLWLKVWDMHNNSSQSEVKFTVKDDALPEIASVYCNANPFSLSSEESIRFVAQYALPDNTLTVNLDVFDRKGHRVYHTAEYAYSASNEIYFDWSPSQLALNPGLYFYRVTINDGEKLLSGKSEKLLLTD